ncbi:MAG: 16S rRNA (cytidine(1402)-2'-O)-methyltransferase [Patescibacteria group bacterium]|nr:16S rRNA (cytidine(1402)-2'-O)-methyltransferase [Patescibacteria group bacterium]
MKNLNSDDPLTLKPSDLQVSKIGTLYVIATPIGNLGDMTLRAVETLKNVDVLFAEDTRVTRRLLTKFDIQVPLESYREQVHSAKAARVIGLLRDGKDVGLVSDAGTPGVSDPGAMLVRDVLQDMPDARIVPAPGPSAVVAAVSVAGFPSDAFTFFGFPPHKKGRNAFFDEVVDCPHTVVLYESPHRVLKTLGQLAECVPDRRLCILRELTKMHESSYRCTAAEAVELVSEHVKGEFVIVMEGRRYSDRRNRK